MGRWPSKDLRGDLFDPRVSRDIRLNIPRTLSKIHSQAAMNALLGGLLEEDRSIRFKGYSCSRRDGPPIRRSLGGPRGDRERHYL